MELGLQDLGGEVGKLRNKSGELPRHIRAENRAVQYVLLFTHMC